MLKELLPANRFEEIWTGAGAGGPPGAPGGSAPGAGDRVLASLSILARSGQDAAASLRAVLGMALEAAGAERLFFFDVPLSVAGEPPVLGQCIASLNIDLEPIRDPEAKVPLQLLKEVLASERAILIGDAQADPRRQAADLGGDLRVRALGAVPLLVRGKPTGLVYFDNRFRPLLIDDRTGIELAGLCHALGFLHHGERLAGENRSLWQDVARLKEETRPAGGLLLPSKSETRSKAGRARYRGDYSFIVGSSTPMHDIFQLLDRVSGSNAPVLINGESGSGKELVANALHRSSPRNQKPFISENCGALTETLLESELFGYVKGAFTGASKDHKGLFELADSGTLFLDEVGDMSPSMQKKLLRVLQEGVIRRVGGKDFIHVDVRLICATNKDLLEECRQGRFREDLYYRLNVINIRVPALRERKEDIPELVEHFLADLSQKSGVQKALEPAAMKRLSQYSWPGNIRELQNEVKRMFALSEASIRLSDISENILKGDGRDFLHPGLEKELADLTLNEATEKLEKEMIRRALYTARGNKSLVAKKLQIPKTSLYNKINKYQLEKDLP